MWQAAVASLALVLLFPRFVVGQQNETLADALRRDAVPTTQDSIHHLNDPITSYAELNTDQEFLIAYYLATPQNELRFPLMLARFDKQSEKWRETSFTGLKVKVLVGGIRWWEDDCIGSVMSVEHNGDWYYLNLHWNPSAGCMVILNRDLTVHQTLTGWTAAFFKSGSLLYKGSMVHFAPVHPETLFLYDPSADKSQRIYPQENDPLRRDFSKRLEKILDKNQCQENQACNPETFETAIDKIEVNDTTDSLAFRVDFSPIGFLDTEAAQDSGQWDDDQYVYLYRFNPLRWREFSIYDLKPKFGTDSLKELLTPEKLDKVFATPAPR